MPTNNIDLADDTTNGVTERISRNAELSTELLFIMLPFATASIVMATTGNAQGILSLPEWSIAAAVLAGQTVVRFVQEIMPVGNKLRVGLVSLIIAVLIVGIIAPSLVVMTLLMTLSQVNTLLVVAQILLFLASVVVFLFLENLIPEIYLNVRPDAERPKD